MGRNEDERHLGSTARSAPLVYNRRIGARVRVDPAAVEWLPLLPRKRWRRPRPPQRGEVVELSITGARVRAPADRQVTLGTEVIMTVAGMRGLVEVRRVHATIDPARAYYGVQFVRLDDALRDLIHRTLAVRRPGDLAWRWEHAE